VRRFEDEVAIVVERYDRVRTASMAAAAAAESAMWAARAVVEPAGAARAAAAAARAAALGELAERQPILRLHQEDLCQALGLKPTAKYQNEGGPGPDRIADLLRTYSGNPDEDIATFIDALAFNWLIGGTDGHAKNYSLLHGGGGRVRLAPLYDLASALPYGDMDQERLALAMKVGDKYRLRHIRRSDWERLARDVRLPPKRVVERVADLAARLPTQVVEIRERVSRDGLVHPIVERLARALADRARACAGLLRN
jgi:serine/threonine-protein kinase HipA